MMAHSELPHGWIQQVDETSGNPFFVDTKVQPPRSIWTHPYEDPQFLREHPEINRKWGSSNNESKPLKNPAKESFLGKMKKKVEMAAHEHSERKRQERELQSRFYGVGTQGGSQFAAQPQYGHTNYTYGQPMVAPRRRQGGAGKALPLVGGLAGGMLLGNAMNDFGDDDYGGGDFGGDF